MLDQLREVKAMLEFKSARTCHVTFFIQFRITIEDEVDPTKSHCFNAYRAQHSFHRLPTCVLSPQRAAAHGRAARAASATRRT